MLVAVVAVASSAEQVQVLPAELAAADKVVHKIVLIMGKMVALIQVVEQAAVVTLIRQVVAPVAQV
jgi:heme/copper-type cytochrome/quinol oxidase subunit 2